MSCDMVEPVVKLSLLSVFSTWSLSYSHLCFANPFVVAARSLLVPLSVQQTKSAEYTKALKPYMAEIKEKFKDNQEAQNRAIAKLFDDANQNPLSGCLLSIAQLPVLLGLYRGIRLLAIDGELDEGFLWIPSLQGPVSAPDFRGMSWLTEGWDTSVFPPVPQMGWETTAAFLIMPVLLVLGQSLTMSLLSPAMEPDENMSEEEKKTMEQSQGVLKFLPLMIGYFSLQVPAGLTIYWFVSNIFSVTQSTLVKAYYTANPPEIDLPDYWESLDDMEGMTPEEKRKAAEAGINTGPTLDDLVDGAFLSVQLCFDSVSILSCLSLGLCVRSLLWWNHDALPSLTRMHASFALLSSHCLCRYATIMFSLSFDTHTHTHHSCTCRGQLPLGRQA